MAEFLKRPVAVFDPEKGLLRNDHFQIAYVTNDIERAQNIFGDTLGVEHFQTVEGATPSGGHMRVDVAWVGSTMYELVQTGGTGMEFYNAKLPTDGFGLQFHHLGYFIHDLAAWQAMSTEVARRGWSIPMQNWTPGFMRYCFVEVPALGHFLEFILPEQGGIDFFESIPAN